MCGRFDRHSELDQFADLVTGLVIEGAPDLSPSYNVAPSQHAWVIAPDAEGTRRCATLRWGLAPSWSRDPSMKRPINARAEGVAGKPMFRSAFARHRCVVPCDGYYEWGRTASGKQPYYFHMPEHAPFLLAGIFERNRHLFDEPLDTFCLITRPALEGVAAVHHRMPLILDPDEIDTWLDPQIPVESLEPMMLSEDVPEPSFHPVSTFVNSPANNTPRCAEPLPEGA